MNLKKSLLNYIINEIYLVKFLEKEDNEQNIKEENDIKFITSVYKINKK